MRAVPVLLAVCVLGYALSGAGSTNIVKHQRHARSLEAAVATNNGEWQAPLATDCRSPCPALNTLANHGLIPRDGKNYDVDTLRHALIDVLNLGKVFGEAFAKLATKKFADPHTGKFSLCDLLINIHNTNQPSGSAGIEHTASLSRVDRPNGDFTHATDTTQRSPAQSQINELIKSATGAAPNAVINVAGLMATRTALWANSFKAQPALEKDSLNNQERIIADVEGCLLLGALAGNSNGGTHDHISASYAQSILFSERLPDGWTKTPSPFGTLQLFQCMFREVRAWGANELKDAATKITAWLPFSLHDLI